MKETDMFPLLKSYLESKGFKVQAEVNDIDIVASNDETMLVVEMKTQFSVKLLYQGCQRQKVCDHVYVAIPPIRKRKLLKERMHILRRLHLGLLFVDIKNETVEAILDPTDYVFRRSKKKRNRLLREMHRRITTTNVGGTTGQKLITSYRESVIKIAYHLLEESKSIKELKELTKEPKVSSILQKNYYQWFERVSRGVYTLTELGRSELIGYEDLFEELHLKSI